MPTDALSAISPRHSVTVSASAGTGKTWLLVTRLVRLLLAGARPDAILAVTFTRKAAAEMQGRLGERLFDLASSRDSRQLRQRLEEIGAPTDATTMERAQQLYEDLLNTPYPLKATTFHAFCQDILRRFPREAGVAPGFELLEASAELQDAAWDALIAEAGEVPNTAVARALETLIDTTGGLANLRTALDGFLNHRSDWWAFTEGRDEPLQFAIGTLAAQLGVNPDTDPLQDFFNNQRLAALTEFARLLGRHETQRNLEHAALLATALCEPQDHGQLLAAATQVLFTGDGSPRSRKASATQAKSLGAEGEARLLELHSRLCAELQGLQDSLAAQQTLASTSAWYRAGIRLLEHYQRLKTEQRLLDFADLEWRAYRLLNHADNTHWVQYKLDQRIDHLLVDEFQDTNPTQWRLIFPLLQELASAEDERGRSVFLVGDAKQSIYRFRRADPALFDAAQAWLQRHLQAIEQPLNTSWRSAPAIMAFVNRVFGEGPLLRRLGHFPTHDTHRRSLWGRVELLPLAESPDDEQTPQTPTPRNPLEHPRPVRPDQRHLQEARQVAATIRRLLDERLPVGSGDEARPIRCDDILILLQKRTHASAFEQALREAGIPYSGAERGTLLDGQEAQDMVNLLELLAAPFNNLALAGLLRSPLFDCPHADLITLARRPQGNWLERLTAVCAETSPPPGEEPPLRRAQRLLEGWLQLAGVTPVHDLLDRIFCEGDVLARYQAAYPAHLQQRVSANLSRFLELALEIDSGRYPSIGHFIARLRGLQQREQGAPDEGRPLRAEARVQIMTIHGAKGLEAPVVFLADSTNTASIAGAHQALVDWPAERDRPESFLLTGKKSALDPYSKGLLEQHGKAALREDANLLYVALTRARQCLYLSGSRPARGNHLGWYGLVAAQCGRDGGEGGVLFENGDAAVTTVPATPPTAAEAGIDPRLAAPIPGLEATLSDIAPSRAPGAATGASETAEAQTRGLAIHRLLQLISEGAEDVAQRVAGELGLAVDDAELKAWEAEAEGVLRAPQLQHLFDPAQYDAAYNEAPLHYRQAGLWVYGIVDRLVVRGAEVWLLDYKTRALDAAAAARLAEHYRPQILHYREGVARLWPDKTIHSGLLFSAGPYWVDVAG